MKKIVLIALILIVAGSLYFFNKTEKEVTVEWKVYSEGEVEKSLEELPFHVKLPAYLPDGVTSRESVIYVLDGEPRSIELNYLNENYGEGFLFDASLGSLDALPETIKWKDIYINESIGYIGHVDDTGETFLYWMNDRILYQICSNNISEDEIVKIAASLY
ncbi:MAG: DUF4367 domain-containing protein [Bacillaceae bacterium]|nr:DUF4367 domain-containing protein [Bacillaceae bacterium]